MSVSEEFFRKDNEKIDGDFQILHDNNIVEDKIADVNIFQPLTQKNIPRKVKDMLAAIKYECTEGR